MTLHEAIQIVLKQYNRPMNAKEIADQVNLQNLYKRDDGNQVPLSQIHARVNKYQNLFLYNEKKEILGIQSVNGILFEISRKLHNILRTCFIHDEISIKKYDLFIPACFFFKRMIDNPDLMQNHLGISNEGITLNLSGMNKFYRDLNNSSTQFHGKLSDLISDIVYLNEIIDNSIFDLLEDQNLSQTQYSNTEFGQFFNLLFYKDSQQKINQGQFITPEIIGKLIFKLCEREIHTNTKVYNPGAGLSSIPTLFAQNSTNKFQFFGEEINTDIYILSLMNLISNDINVSSFFNRDSFEKYPDPQKYDLLICVPPFSGVISGNEYSFKFPINTRDLTSLFIQHSVCKINDHGKAVIVVPEGILFKNNESSKKLREYLLENKFIEAIVSLPAGIFQPYTGIKTSILILSRKQNSNILFINAEEFHATNKDNTLLNSLNIDQITSLFYRNINSNQANEPTVQYGKSIAGEIPIGKINRESYDFILKPYLNETLEDDEKVELFQVLSEYSGNNVFRDDLKFVAISDLSSSNDDFNLNFNNLKPNRTNQDGRYIDTPVLLVASIASGIRATYYDQSNGPIVISRSIYAYKIDTEKINLEYLIYELNKKSVIEQIKAISSGVTSLNRFTMKSFLKIRIEIPHLNKQKEIIKIYKEAIYQEKLKEAQRYAHENPISGKSERDMLGFVKHEIGNITGGIQSDVFNLKSFISKKSISLEEKISGRLDASTLNDVFSRMHASISDVENLMTNIQNIIDLGSGKIQKETALYKGFINNELHKLSGIIKEHGVEVYIGVDDKYNGKLDRPVLIDPLQFSVVIRNFIFNSIKHGFIKEQYKCIIINLTDDDDYYYLNLINNGTSFLEGFTLQDFLKFGGRSDTSKGSGIGGYLIGKIVENHGGEISLQEPGNTLFLNEPISIDGKEIYGDHTLIMVGVHFIIKLPKE